ncbi:MAG: hypothetical protein V1839_00760 [archaeon]
MATSKQVVILLAGLLLLSFIPAACAQEELEVATVFSQDFSSGMAGVVPLSGAWALENGKLESFSGEASISIGALTDPKISVLVTPLTLSTEGPEIVVRDSRNRFFTCDFYNTNRRLRMLEYNPSGHELTTSSASLPTGFETRMSLEVSGSTITCRLGSATATKYTDIMQPITQVKLSGYTSVEQGLWDNLVIEAKVPLTKETMLSRLSELGTRVTPLQNKGYTTDVLQAAMSKVSGDLSRSDLSAARADYKAADTLVNSAVSAANEIDSAAKPISDAESISADVSEAKAKLAEAKDMMNKGSYELATSSAAQAKDLANTAPVIGRVQVKDLLASASLYDKRQINMQGKANSIMPDYSGAGYAFNIDDGTGLVNVSYSGSLAKIKSGSEVKVTGIFDYGFGSAEQVEATVVEPIFFTLQNILIIIVLAVAMILSIVGLFYAFQHRPVAPVVAQRPVAARVAPQTAPARRTQQYAPAPQVIAPESVPKILAMIMIIGIILMIIGAAGPWASITGIYTKQTTYGYEGDGIFVLFFGIISLIVMILTFVRVGKPVVQVILAQVFCALAALIAVFDATNAQRNIERGAADFFGGLLGALLAASVTIEWGPYLVAIGGFTALITGIIYDAYCLKS